MDSNSESIILEYSWQLYAIVDAEATKEWHRDTVALLAVYYRGIGVEIHGTPVAVGMGTRPAVAVLPRLWGWVFLTYV